MAIHVLLDEVMRKRGMTVVELERRTGITAANLSRLKTGRGRAVRFSTLNAICLALDCQPGDLFEFVPDEAVSDPEKGRG